MLALLNFAQVLHVMRARYIYRHDRFRPLLLCALKNELHQFTLYLFIISHSELGQYSPEDMSKFNFNVVESVAKFSVLFVVLFAIVHTFMFYGLLLASFHSRISSAIFLEESKKLKEAEVFY